MPQLPTTLWILWSSHSVRLRDEQFAEQLDRRGVVAPARRRGGEATARVSPPEPEFDFNGTFYRLRDNFGRADTMVTCADELIV